jgi:hypothetical protein
VPTLGHGFSSDDFWVVPTTRSQFVENPFSADLDGRPIDVTFALLPKDTLVHHAVSLLVYLACIGLMWQLCRQMALGS